MSPAVRPCAPADALSDLRHRLSGKLQSRARPGRSADSTSAFEHCAALTRGTVLASKEAGKGKPSSWTASLHHRSRHFVSHIHALDREQLGEVGAAS